MRQAKYQIVGAETGDVDVSVEAFQRIVEFVGQEDRRQLALIEDLLRPVEPRHVGFGGSVHGWGYAESVLIYKDMAVITPGRLTVVHNGVTVIDNAEFGPIASPDLIQFAPGLPKTRSGKIMRRILRKIAEDDFGNLGDTSTLADPAVVGDLVENRQNRR